MSISYTPTVCFFSFSLRFWKLPRNARQWWCPWNHIACVCDRKDKSVKQKVNAEKGSGNGKKRREYRLQA